MGLHRGRRGVQVRGQLVGHLDDPPIGALADRQRVGLGPESGGVGRWEGAGEVEDVGDRGSPPAVDGLVGVADGGDRVPEAVLRRLPGEELAQQVCLGHRGVLVLVEEHDGILLALDAPDLRLGTGQLRRQRDLVGEVHQPELLLEPAVALDQVEDLGALGHLVQDLGDLALGPRGLQRGLEARPLPRLPGADIVDAAQVLVELAVEREEVVDGELRVLAEHLDRAGVPLDGPGGHLVAGRVGHHPRVGLEADPQAVLGEQGGGIGVVRRDDGLDALGGLTVVADHPLVEPGGGQRGADLGRQLGRRLGGEGQPEHLVGPHLPRRHEVDHPGRHHRGLAGTRSGDDHAWHQGSPDRLPLRRAELEGGLHQARQVGGRPQTLLAGHGGHARHESTDPDTWAGHSGLKSHRSHSDDGRAGKSSRRSCLCGPGELPLDGEPALVVGHLGPLDLHLEPALDLPAQLPELGPTGLGAERRQPLDAVERPVVDRELVEPELGVLGQRLVGRGVLPGLQVDHDDTPLVVELEAVGVAGQRDLRAVGKGHLGAQLGLGVEHRTRPRTRVPGQQPAQRLAHLVALTPPRPGRAEAELVPDLVDEDHQPVDVDRRAREVALGEPVGDRVHDVAEALGLAGLAGTARLALQEPLGRALEQAGQRAGRELHGPVGGPHR